MEPIADYLRRKNIELSWMNARLCAPVEDVCVADCEAVTRRKFELRSRLLAELVAARPELTETWSQPEGPLSLSGWQLRYFYQRFDLKVEGPAVYPSWDYPLIRRTRFTSSGMGALSAVFLALDKVLRRCVLCAMRDAYFETLELTRHLTKSIEVREAASPLEWVRAARDAPAATVLLVDSYSVEDPALMIGELRPDDVDLVVFDSTMYDAASPRIEALVGACVALAVPVLVVRSHLKLDFLGVEWGRLGSVVGMMSPFGTSTVRQRLFREVQRQMDYCIRWLGTGPLPVFLTPFAGDPVFSAMNTARLAEGERNNRWLAARVARELPNALLVDFHHGRFFTIDPFPEEDNFQPIRDAIDKLVVRADGLAIRHGNSFGFDFTALASAVDGHRGGRRVLRVSAGDLPDEVMEGTARILCEVLRELTANRNR